MTFKGRFNDLKMTFKIAVNTGTSGLMMLMTFY